MEFGEFKNRIPNIKNIALPGEAAHHKLAPLRRIRELENIDIDSKNPNNAGVMAVFYPGAAHNTQLVLILRKTYQGVHSNQIGFPGGRSEEVDKNLKYTALRETEEEVGIPRNEVQVIRKLTKLYIPPSNFWVQPYMGLLENTPKLVPQPEEVERIIEVDLDDFMDANSLITTRLSTFYAKDIEVPAFQLKGHIVWGATGMMLNEIRELLGKVL